MSQEKKIGYQKATKVPHTPWTALHSKALYFMSSKVAQNTSSEMPRSRYSSLAGWEAAMRNSSHTV